MLLLARETLLQNCMASPANSNRKSENLICSTNMNTMVTNKVPENSQSMGMDHYYMAKFVSGLYARNGAFWLVPWAGDTFLYSPLREVKLHTRAVDGLLMKKKTVVCRCCWFSRSGISEQPWRKYICEANSSLWREKFSTKVPPRVDCFNCKL